MATVTPIPTTELAAPAPDDRLKGAKWWRVLSWRYLVAIAACVYAAIPVLYIISAALNPTGTVSSTGVIPRQFSWVNFEALVGNPGRPFFQWYLNTIIVAVCVVFVQLLFSSFGAYAFSRLRWKGRRSGLLALLLVQMFPGILVMVALFRMFSTIGDVFPFFALDTLAGYTFVMMGGSLGGVFLMKGVFDSIPSELDEAAKIDGAGHVRIFFTVILPLVRSILVISGLLTLVGVIGEFILASIFLRSTGVKTLAVGMYSIITADRSNNLGWFCAASLCIAIPVVALFMWLQKYIVGGITAGSVKG